ncbi:MAG: hypothetical protein ABIH37_00795 [archaeon]
MVEKDRIYKGKVKQKGIFNFKDSYQFLFDYLKDENYDITEEKYVEKVEGESKNLEIIWTGTKEVSDYFRFEYRIRWWILGMKKIRVKKEGQEITMDSGTVEIRFESYLQKDYENRWENNPFFKFIRGFYDRYIMKSRADDFVDRLFNDTLELIAQAKSFLAIEGQHQ